MGRDVRSIDVKTLQYVVIDNFTGDVTVAGYVGKTIDYTDGRSKRASASGLTYDNFSYAENDGSVFIQLNVDVADPLVPYAAAIDDHLQIHVSTGGAVHVEGTQDGFPAHEIWVYSGEGYHLLYGYYDGSIEDLAPILGDTQVDETYTP